MIQALLSDLAQEVGLLNTGDTIELQVHTVTSFAVSLFFVGMLGSLIMRRDLILILISIEIMLLASIIDLMALSSAFECVEAEIFILLILVVAAAETAVVLSIIYNFYSLSQTIDLEVLDCQLDNLSMHNVKIEERGVNKSLRN